jgi:hypothetical protein
MKKYKLIKKYPSLPKDWEEGMEIGYGDRRINLSPCNGKYTNRHIADSEVINQSEFWEEIVEKEYEILSVLQPHVNLKYTLIKNKQFGNSYNGDVYYHSGAEIRGFDMLDKIKNNAWKIHSVKRLSDGEIFTVGDKITDGIITKFDILNVLNGVLIAFIDNSSWLSLRMFTKAKQPLFKTEDSVDIYEGDNYFSVDENYWRVLKPEITCKINYETYHKHRCNFSSKEKAEEYIIMNKPCLSVNDVLHIAGILTIERSKLIEFVKSKLCITTT